MFSAQGCSLPPPIFEREYMCKFTSSGDTYLDAAALAASEVPPDYPEKLGFAYQSTRFYVGFDLGQKQSHSAIVVLPAKTATP